jgi:hypothetical protein
MATKEWKDAINLRGSRAFELEGGRFQLPFGREMLTGRSESGLRSPIVRREIALAATSV